MNILPNNPNLAALLAAARRLKPMLDEIAFVGGCVTGLLVSDPAAAPVRPTIDVDAIIEIASYTEFTALQARLAQLGFHQSAQQDAPICRWCAENLILDLMPTDPSILGFSSRWYRPAFVRAQRLKIEELEVQLVTAPYFLATKVEAFHGRGKNDFQLSHDIEDIITVIDGRPELVDEISKSELDVRLYLQAEFKTFVSDSSFRDALSGHLLPDSASQQRIGIVLERIQRIITQV